MRAISDKIRAKKMKKITATKNHGKRNINQVLGLFVLGMKFLLKIVRTKKSLTVFEATELDCSKVFLTKETSKVDQGSNLYQI